MPDSTNATAHVLKGKRGLIMGVANNRSIAWGIAKACAEAGAELAFTYQGDALKKRVEPLAKELGGHVVGHCDVTDSSTIDAVFAEVEKLWGKLDFVVHCIAFSDKDELTGRYVETTRRQLHQVAADLLLLLHRRHAAGREADEPMAARC